jgi:hypothetical protein
MEFASELVALWLKNQPTHLPVLDRKDIGRSIAVLAHVEHAVKCNQAIKALCSQGLLVQAVPLIRLTMECAVSAAWFAVTPDSGRSAGYEGARQRLNLAQSLSKLSGSNIESVVNDLRENQRELEEFISAEARKFEARAQALAGIDWVYAGYRQLSELAHAGTPLMDHYLRPAAITPTAPLGVEYSTEYEFKQAPILFSFQPVLLHLALLSWDTISEVHPMRARLRAMAKTAEIPVEIERRKTRRQESAKRATARREHR